MNSIPSDKPPSSDVSPRKRAASANDIDTVTKVFNDRRCEEPQTKELKSPRFIVLSSEDVRTLVNRGTVHPGEGTRVFRNKIKSNET